MSLAAVSLAAVSLAAVSLAAVSLAAVSLAAVSLAAVSLAAVSLAAVSLAAVSLAAVSLAAVSLAAVSLAAVSLAAVSLAAVSLAAVARDRCSCCPSLGVELSRRFSSALPGDERGRFERHARLVLARNSTRPLELGLGRAASSRRRASPRDNERCRSRRSGPAPFHGATARAASDRWPT